VIPPSGVHVDSPQLMADTELADVEMQRTARLVIRLAGLIGASVPIGGFALARRVEQFARLVQGKGWVSGTVGSEVGAILRLLPSREAVVLDVGANHGLWTRTLLERARSNVGRILLFEPSLANATHLAPLATDPIVEVVSLALSDVAETRTLYSDRPGSGLASLHRRRLEHFNIRHEAIETVRTTTLDEYTREAGIDRIDFMKLDVEGHEFNVLRGALGLLASGRIRALSFEFGGGNLDSRTYFQDFWYLLSGFGFRLHRIVPGGRLLPIERYTEDLESFSATNYVAVLARG
jgi:FkbM family methyltransferase